MARMHESAATGRGGFAKWVDVTVQDTKAGITTVTVDSDGLYLQKGQTVTVPADAIQAR